ncbi:MAG TPA: hypothetical protein VJ739_07825 [Gemmataceae bacterium]|nr:hypothetical protein [Gemmataceae bacterium]
MNVRMAVAVALLSLAGAGLALARDPAEPPAQNTGPAPNVDAFLKRWDVNQDGRISRHEAKGKLRELFDELDRNHDGYLDKIELQAGLQKHPELVGKMGGKDTPMLPSVSPPKRPPAVKPNNPGQ